VTNEDLAGAIAGYPKGSKLLNYEGRVYEGVRLEVYSSWAVKSWVGTKMYAYRARDAKGREYHGRGFGDGMLLILRPKGHKRRRAEG
jgi:hypothetical protein